MPRGARPARHRSRPRHVRSGPSPGRGCRSMCGPGVGPVHAQCRRAGDPPALTSWMEPDRRAGRAGLLLSPLLARGGDKPPGKGAGLPHDDHPAHHRSREDVEYHVEVVVGPLGGALQLLYRHERGQSDTIRDDSHPHAAGRGGSRRPAADLGRGVPLLGVAEAELAVAVEAPGPEGAVRLHCQSVAVAAGDARPVVGAAHSGRGESGGGIAHAELADIVVAPGPEGAVLLHGQTEVVAAGDGRPVMGGADPGRGEPVARVAQAELTEAVATPGPEAAVLLQGQGDGEVAGDARPVVGAAYSGRAVSVVDIAEAQFAGAVVAPGPEGAVVLQA